LIQFILNDKPVKTELPKGLLLLDFVRYHQYLTGTKIGCREGDCGACTVLVGELKNGELVYRSATSCLMAIGNAAGKHIVTIEGINVQGLNFIQQCFADEGATQCGFCTPGFMVSLAGYALCKNEASYNGAIDAVNGNICRCTGYKSIERATGKIAGKLAERKDQDAMAFAVTNNFLPAYFMDIKERLVQLMSADNEESKQNNTNKFLGGGTDLYVQQHDAMTYADINFLFDKKNLNGITQVGNVCYMGAATTVTDIAESPVFQQYFSSLPQYIKLVSSTPIRNMATIAGNFVNASPIGDFTIFFLALNARLVLSNGISRREIPLNEFYKGYKQLAKNTEEFIEQVYFELPSLNTKFNFEKVCKRTHLDIASVNSAVSLQVDDELITSAHLSAGGVGPIPFYLSKASTYLKGQNITAETIENVITIAMEEVSPISDARGTAAYKRFLLGQLIKAHFITMFPEHNFQKMIAV
jgi:xanthine dehydrogenase small subunit